MLKNKIVFAVIFALILSNPFFCRADDYDFENNEEYYSELCSDSRSLGENRAACQAFSDYQHRRYEETKTAVSDLTERIRTVNEKIQELQQIADSLNTLLLQGLERELYLKTITDQITDAESQPSPETIFSSDYQISSKAKSLLSDLMKKAGSLLPCKEISLPLAGLVRVTSGFPYTDRDFGEFSGGVEMISLNSDEVYASGNGLVVNVYNHCKYNSSKSCGNGHGNYVQYIISYEGSSYLITSSHLDEVYVSIGEEVKAGETVIGVMGNTGYSFGKHLHQMVIDMEVNDLSKAIDYFCKTGLYYFGLQLHVDFAKDRDGASFASPEEFYGIYFQGQDSYY